MRTIVPHLTTRSLLALALVATACKEEKPAETPAVKPPPAAPVVAPPPPPASASGQSQPDCVGPFTTEGAPTEFKIGALTAKRTGAVLEISAAAGEQHTVGLIANLKEATGENLFNLKKYVAQFQAEKVEAILVAGDSGESKDGIADALEPLAASGLPVLAVPGNREPRADFRAAAQAIAAKHPNFVDMTSVRLVKLGFASVVSLPGYYDKRFIHVGDAGCQYFKEDVAALEPIVAAATQPVILLSHAEPYGKGRGAIDAFGDGNAGDSNLTALMRKINIPFGVFANIHEAGGRATDLDANPAKEGELKDKLYVNVGLADSTPWKLNDGTWSYGMAATLTVKGPQASFKTLHLKQLTEAEQGEARALEGGQK